MIQRKSVRVLYMVAALTCIASGCATVARSARVAPVRVETDTIESKSLGSRVAYNVVLPAGYPTAGIRYPVLWLLHGYGGGKDDWLKRTDIVRQVERYPFIVVLPAAENSWYVNSPSNPAAEYQDFITTDLYNDVLQRFAVDTLRQAIAGLSMGGYGAVMLALRYPQRYGFAGGLSAALSVPSPLGSADSVLWKGTGKSIIAAFGARDMTPMAAYDPLRLFRNTRPDALPYIFLAIGTRDGFPSFLPANRAFTDSLRAYGAAYEYHEIPGTHSWLVWQAELGPMLESAWKTLESRKPRVP